MIISKAITWAEVQYQCSGRPEISDDKISSPKTAWVYTLGNTSPGKRVLSLLGDSALVTQGNDNSLCQLHTDIF